jgi:hypothetical protein
VKKDKKHKVLPSDFVCDLSFQCDLPNNMLEAEKKFWQEKTSKADELHKPREVVAIAPRASSWLRIMPTTTTVRRGMVMIPTSASSSNSQHIPTSEDNGKKEEVVVQKIKERRKSLMMFDQIQEPITASNDSEISNEVSSYSATSSASASSTNHQQLPSSGGDDDDVVENVVGWARAAWAFSPADDSELEFNKGYLVAVTSWTNSDWWAGFAFKSYDDAQVTFSEPARVFPGVFACAVTHSLTCVLLFLKHLFFFSSLPFPNMCLLFHTITQTKPHSKVCESVCHCWPCHIA